MRDKKAEKADKKKKKGFGRTMKAIGSYIFFWPSMRKYATYIRCFFSKKDKNRYDYWKKD